MLKYNTKIISNKGKIGKLEFCKIKDFCVAKDTTKTVKRQSIEWNKIFAKHISD